VTAVRLLVLAAAVLLGAGWLWWHGSVEEPAVAVSQPAPVQELAPRAGAGASPGTVPPGTSASAAPLQAQLAEESAAGLLRKVQLAFGTGSAQDALEAANVLQSCLQATKGAEAMHTARDVLSLLPEAIKEAIEGFITNEQLDSLQSHARRCQVFDEAALARRGELFQQAYEGGAQGAATSYLNWLTQDGKADADPAVVEMLQADVRQAARRGDFGTLASFAFMVDPQPFGASRTEREAYKEAWLRIAEEGGPGSAAKSRELIAKLERLSNLPPLTAEQQQEAEALAQAVYEANRQHNGKGG
jgi:hypothetical protein